MDVRQVEPSQGERFKGSDGRKVPRDGREKERKERKKGRERKEGKLCRFGFFYFSSTTYFITFASSRSVGGEHFQASWPRSQEDTQKLLGARASL